jgi:hypothetical protein
MWVAPLVPKRCGGSDIELSVTTMPVKTNCGDCFMYASIARLTVLELHHSSLSEGLSSQLCGSITE